MMYFVFSFCFSIIVNFTNRNWFILRCLLDADVYITKSHYVVSVGEFVDVMFEHISLYIFGVWMGVN